MPIGVDRQRFERLVSGRETSSWDRSWDRRFRRRLRRRVWVTRLATFALIGIAALSLARSVTQGEPDHAETQLVTVHVAARDLMPGEIITADDVRPHVVDEALSPAHAATDAIGAGVASKILEGEVVHEARLGSTGRLGLGRDERAVALTRPLASLPLEVGDVVELLAIVAGGPAGASSSTVGTGRVLAVDGDQIAVAVPTEQVTILLEYQAIGTVELALTPWRSN